MESNTDSAIANPKIRKETLKQGQIQRVGPQTATRTGKGTFKDGKPTGKVSCLIGSPGLPASKKQLQRAELEWETRYTWEGRSEFQAQMKAQINQPNRSYYKVQPGAQIYQLVNMSSEVRVALMCPSIPSTNSGSTRLEAASMTASPTTRWQHMPHWNSCTAAGENG